MKWNCDKCLLKIWQNADKKNTSASKSMEGDTKSLIRSAPCELALTATNTHGSTDQEGETLKIEVATSNES